ncbi:MAG: hypothetical protein K8F51_02220, partial [Comamonas sp.]|nr:hypothetical protein [Comamonas sp.]
MIKILLVHRNKRVQAARWMLGEVFLLRYMYMNETESKPLALRHPEALAQRVDAVMSDLDGTLVDTLGDFCAAVNRTLADLRLPAIAAGEIALRVGKGSEHLL